MTDSATGERAVVQPAQWYLRSGADHDTHRGRLHRDGTVLADCGAVFRPRVVAFGRLSLPGYPPDPDQVCRKCDRA